MKGVLRYMAALLAVIALMGAAAAGLVCCMTTGAFLREAYGTEALQTQTQARIEQAAAQLAQAWSLSPETLAPYVNGAAEKQAEAVAAWWDDLWSAADAELAMPAFLDATEERELIAAIMADEGFRAVTEETQRRAIARDEIAYALDEAVCDVVTPLRRSIVDMGVSLAAERVSLMQLRRAALLGALLLAGVGLALLIPAHRLAGSALTATGGLMALCAVSVWRMDVPGMLAQLSPIAEAQGCNAMICMGIVWLGTAAVLAVAGLVIICIKRVAGRRNT